MKPLVRQSALSAAGLLLTGRMLNRFLGLGREMLTAAFFGAGRAMDGFNLSFTVVTSMRQLLAEQFYTPTLPVYFQRRREEGEEAALLSLRRITTRLNSVALLACLALALFARPIISLIATGFSPEQIRLSTILVRWFSIGGIGFILYRYYGALFMCFFQYRVLAFAPLLINVMAVICIVFFGVKFGVISLAAGFSLGYLAVFLLQAFRLPHRNFLLKPQWGKNDPGVRAFRRMLLPLFVTVFAEQIQLYVDRGLAAGLAEGSLSAQGYALRLIRTSSDFWSGTFEMVVFPVFASLVASERREELARHFSLALQGFVLFLVLTGAVMIALALPTVQLLLEHGHFDREDSLLTAKLLIYYAVAYICQAIMLVIVRGFHALGDTKTPMLTMLISVVLMTAADFLLVGPLGISGLALAMALGYGFNLILIYTLFSRRLPRNYTLQTVRIFLLAMVLATPLGWLVWRGWSLLESLGLVSHFAGRLTGLLLFSGLATLSYALVLRLLRVDAFAYFLQKIKERRKSKGATG